MSDSLDTFGKNLLKGLNLTTLVGFLLLIITAEWNYFSLKSSTERNDQRITDNYVKLMDIDKRYAAEVDNWRTKYYELKSELDRYIADGTELRKAIDRMNITAEERSKDQLIAARELQKSINEIYNILATFKADIGHLEGIPAK